MQENTRSRYLPCTSPSIFFLGVEPPSSEFWCLIWSWVKSILFRQTILLNSRSVCFTVCWIKDYSRTASRQFFISRNELFKTIPSYHLGEWIQTHQTQDSIVESGAIINIIISPGLATIYNNNDTQSQSILWPVPWRGRQSRGAGWCWKCWSVV